jgi:hypothetical protein
MFDLFFLQIKYYITPVQPTSFFDKILPSLIGTGTALFLFWLTTIKDKRKTKKDKKEVITDRVEYTKALINTVISTSQQIITLLKKQVLVIRETPSEFHLLTFVPLTDFTRLINALSNEDFFISFNKYFKDETDRVKIYNTVVSRVDYLFAELSELKIMQEKASDYDFARKIKYDEIVRESVSVFRGLMFKQGLHNLTPELNDLQTIVQGHINSSKRTIKNVNEQYFLQLQEWMINRLEATNGQLGPDIEPSSKMILDALNIYDRVLQESEAHATNIESIIKPLSEATNKLNDVVTTLNNYEANSK